MESKEIKDLIELISRSNFMTFEMEREGFKLKLVKAGAAEAAANPVPQLAVPAAVTPVEIANGSAESPAAQPPAETAADDGLYEVNSPIVGTFYRSPSPDAPEFVEVGGRVTKGQVICIVEAMKVMNEIESEVDAEVVEITVANGQPVEYGEVLFRLRPLS